MAKSFENRKGYIWMNGNLVPWSEAKSHVITQGLHYASAVFEGERAYQGKIFKSEQHTKRLFKSAKIIGIDIPFTENEINKAGMAIVNTININDFLEKKFVKRTKGANIIKL